MTTELRSAEALWEMLDPEVRDAHSKVIQLWLDRGDGCAVYENSALDSANAGHRKFVSFGSQEAQLPGEPPARLPDIGADVNWRYRLIATYRKLRVD
jgi:hypothetical protein